MVNKAILIGNLGQDPEIKPMGDRDCVRFSLATNKKYKDKDGVSQSKTTWHNVVVFNAYLVETAKGLKKGAKVYVEGEINNRQYEKDGQQKYISEIVLGTFQSMLTSVEHGSGTGGRPLDGSPDDYEAY